jgi:4-hydroxyphenylpyruvate dioxygenase
MMGDGGKGWDNMKQTRIGTTTSTFGGPLATKLKAMSAAGFVATEFWPKDLFEHPDGPTTAVELLREHGLTVSIYQALRNYEGAPPVDRDQKLGIAEQMMDQMGLISCDLLSLPSNSGSDSSGDREKIVADLARLGDLARSRGMRIAFEPICWGRWISDYRDGWAVVREVNHPNVGLMLDSFHVFLPNSPLAAIADIPGDNIFLVEVADFAPSALEPIEISRHYRLFPGEGNSPMDAFLRQVEKTGYTGCLSVEVFNAFYRQNDPFDTARRGAASMSRLLQSM